MFGHRLRSAGATEKIVAEPALEVFYRVSRGVPRTASHLLRASLMLAHHRDQTFIDEATALDACDDLELTRPRQDLDQPARTPSRKSRK